MIRPAELRRSLLFVAGAQPEMHRRALQAAPDVIIQDLEDSTPLQLKELARDLAGELYEGARALAVIPAVRINPLGDAGIEDLRSVIGARPQLVLLPKAETGSEIAALACELDRLEAKHGLLPGSIEIIPTIETAAGVVNLADIVAGSSRVRSALLGTEDLAADLLAERAPDSEELAYARARFLLECRALRIEPIDHPYTYSDEQGCEAESKRARRLGYRSKSAVSPDHIAAIHRTLTPAEREVAAAHKIIEAFEQANCAGIDRPLVDGLWIEPPAYRNARRVLERAQQLSAFQKKTR
jgi:citrate lyase subunit beta/citryl-CoA lyase